MSGPKRPLVFVAHPPRSLASVALSRLLDELRERPGTTLERALWLLLGAGALFSWLVDLVTG